MGFFKFWQKSEKIVGPAKKGSVLDTVIREHKLTLEDIEVHTVLDYFWLGGAKSEERLVTIKWERPDRVRVTYGKTHYTTDKQEVLLSFDEFADKIKGAFFP